VSIHQKFIEKTYADVIVHSVVMIVFIETFHSNFVERLEGVNKPIIHVLAIYLQSSSNGEKKDDKIKSVIDDIKSKLD
jgi:hypothetical protein